MILNVLIVIYPTGLLINLAHKYADEKEIRKIVAYKNIGIKSAAYLHNREKSSLRSIPNLLH